MLHIGIHPEWQRQLESLLFLSRDTTSLCRSQPFPVRLGQEELEGVVLSAVARPSLSDCAM